MILWRFIYVCGKFHTDTMTQTVIGKEFVKLVWGKWKLFRASLIPNWTRNRMITYTNLTREFIDDFIDIKFVS